MKFALSAASLALVMGSTYAFSVNGGCGPYGFGFPTSMVDMTLQDLMPPPAATREEFLQRQQEMRKRRRMQMKKQKEWIDQAFADLESELNDPSPPPSSSSKNTESSSDKESPVPDGDGAKQRYSSPKPGTPFGFDSNVDPETIQRQKEWVDKAFNFAEDLTTNFATSPDEARVGKKVIRQQQDFINRAFGLVTDAVSETSWTPRSTVLRDDSEAYQVEIEVPGVKEEDVIVDLVQDATALKVKGSRGSGENRREFDLSMHVGENIVPESVSASLKDGILTVSAPRRKVSENVRHVPIV